jgi:hypothetical protein
VWLLSKNPSDLFVAVAAELRSVLHGQGRVVFCPLVRFKLIRGKLVRAGRALWCWSGPLSQLGRSQAPHAD